MPKVEVCLTPALLHLYSLEDKIVVVTDILRATSTMVAALKAGAKAIVPVVNVEDAERFLDKENTIVAGERNGIKVPTFHLGNSPLEILNSTAFVKGKTMVMSTTNGTKAINASLGAKEIVIGAFNNLQATLAYLQEREEDILVLCAGWKDRVNAEDTLYAGAIAAGFSESYVCSNDGALMARQYFLCSKNNLFEAIKPSSHFKRLASHGVEADIKHCMEIGNSSIVAILKDGSIIKNV